MWCYYIFFGFYLYNNVCALYVSNFYVVKTMNKTFVLYCLKQISEILSVIAICIGLIYASMVGASATDFDRDVCFYTENYDGVFCNDNPGGDDEFYDDIFFGISERDGEFYPSWRTPFNKGTDKTGDVLYNNVPLRIGECPLKVWF